FVGQALRPIAEPSKLARPVLAGVLSGLAAAKVRCRAVPSNVGLLSLLALASALGPSNPRRSRGARGNLTPTPSPIRTCTSRLLRLLSASRRPAPHLPMHTAARLPSGHPPEPRGGSALVAFQLLIFPHGPLDRHAIQDRAGRRQRRLVGVPRI